MLQRRTRKLLDTKTSREWRPRTRRRCLAQGAQTWRDHDGSSDRGCGAGASRGKSAGMRSAKYEQLGTTREALPRATRGGGKMQSDGAHKGYPTAGMIVIVRITKRNERAKPTAGKKSKANSRQVSRTQTKPFHHGSRSPRADRGGGDGHKAEIEKTIDRECT